MISVILSSFNEAKNVYFWRNLGALKEGAQLIVVDGGSKDGTLERLRESGVEVILLPDSNRAQRFNRGMEQALGGIVLLVHPRSLVPPEALLNLAELSGGSVWGALTHSFDEKHWLLDFTSWYSNRVRGDGRGIYYLDHCLFISRDLRGDARFPEVDLFEDTRFCAEMRRRQRPVRLPLRVTTSAVRFRKNGIWRQSVMNQVLKVLYHAGVSDRWMHRIYETGLSLNRRAG